jgi:hypothetical protein
MNNLIKFAAVSLSLAFSLSTNAQSSEDMPPATKKAVNTTVVAKNENVKPSVSDPMSSNAKGPDFNKPVQQKPEVQTKPENPTKPVVAPADVVTTKRLKPKQQRLNCQLKEE